MATSGEYGWMAGPNSPKKTAMETPAEISIEPKPTGLMAYSMPRRNSGWMGDSLNSSLLKVMSEATTTIQAMPQLA